MVVKLCQVIPNHFLTVVHTEWIGYAPVFFHKPLGVLFEKSGIIGTMIDDQVDHHVKPKLLRFRNHGTNLIFRRFLSIRAKNRIDGKIVCDGIETP